ncbi:MAG TPA: aldose epimerase, partial [Microbacteriaceae bacterium]|nr:aldose epimerase [Microbacteriaceae bacterium]
MRPSGEQYVIAGKIGTHRVEVTIAEVAAALRSFTVGGIDIVQRYEEGAIPSLGAGIVMAPWPNRVDHGTWINNGVVEQLDITEVKHDNALHGLLRNTAYAVASRSTNSITLTATIYAPNGYPFVVETSVTYTITGNGLEVEHTFRNHSTSPAPVAVGTHGY